MKRFEILWSSLLFTVLIIGLSASLTIFVSEWFTILMVVCVICTAKLMSSVFLEAQLLHGVQKYKLIVTLHRLGYMFLLVAFGCVLYIAKDSADQHIISTAIGIGCFCNYILSHALRNLLWFTSQINKNVKNCANKGYKTSYKLAEKSSLVFHKFCFIVVMYQL